MELGIDGISEVSEVTLHSRNTEWGSTSNWRKYRQVCQWICNAYPKSKPQTPVVPLHSKRRPLSHDSGRRIGPSCALATGRPR